MFSESSATKETGIIEFLGAFHTEASAKPVASKLFFIFNQTERF